MTKSRLEAFSDGVIAILITIMVLEFKVPHEATWAALLPLAPIAAIYVLSFTFLGVYWSNHHHLLQASKHVSGAVLWANHHLLFWLSLVPFVTAWLGEHPTESAPAAAYGVVLLGAAIAYAVLTRCLLARHGPDSVLALAIGSDAKGWFSLTVYSAGIAAAAISPLLAIAAYVVVEIAWIVPDRRIERALGSAGPGG